MNIRSAALWVAQGVLAMFSTVITLFPMFYALSNREYEFLGLNWIEKRSS